MKFSRKLIFRLTIAFTITLLVAIILFVVPYFANIVMPWQKAEAIRTALTWAGIEDLPPHAKNVSVETKGGILTRQFIVRFHSDTTEINEWIQQVQKIKDSVPKRLNDGSIEYEVKPTEKSSNGGTIKLNKQTGEIIIDVSQS